MTPAVVDAGLGGAVLATRAWGGGMPAPAHVGWLHNFGVAIVFFFPSLAMLVVGLRLYGRIKLRLLGYDDLLIVIAMLFSVGFTVTSYMFMLTNYVAIHSWDIPPHDYMPGRVWDFANQVIYNPILAIVKSSALIFLLRLGGTKTGVRWAIHILNAINVSLMIAIFFVVIFSCNPVAYAWDKSIPGGRCITTSPFNISTAIITIVTDVLVLAIPFWILLGLRMPGKIKLALLGVFLLGFIVIIAGCIRLWLLAIYLKNVATGVKSDDAWYSLAFVSSIIEGNLAIITASIPTLWPIARVWFPKFFARLASLNMGPTDSGPSKEKKRVVTIGGTSQHVYQSDASSFVMKPMRGFGQTEIRTGTPSGSEEDMSYNGIVRTTNVRVAYGEGPISKYSPYDKIEMAEGEPAAKNLRSHLGEPEIKRGVS